MTDHGSRAKEKFNTAGELVSREDRNGNTTTVTDTGAGAAFRNLTITAPAGPTNARVITVATDTAGKTTLSQVSGTPPGRRRSPAPPGRWPRSPTRWPAPRRSATTAPGCSAPSAPPGRRRTSFAYDSSNRVTSITQLKDSTGGPGSAVTRLAYVSSSETDLAGPNTDQAQAVTAVPHVTYSGIDSDKRVDKVKDEEGREQSKTYNPVGLTTSTSTGTDSTEKSVTNNTYGNSGESLTKSSTTGGQEMTMSYPSHLRARSATSPPAGRTPAGSAPPTSTTAPATRSPPGPERRAGLARLQHNNDGTVVAAASPNERHEQDVLRLHQQAA